MLIALSVTALPLISCPNMNGSYETENGGIQIYIQKNDKGALKAAINITGYPLTIKKAYFVSEKNLNAQPYFTLPECTLNIESVGYLLPHVKGQIFRMHFDSQDYEKVFTTDYILRLGHVPSENFGVLKSASTIPDKVLTEMNQL